jgi:hypothetical protein
MREKDIAFTDRPVVPAVPRPREPVVARPKEGSASIIRRPLGPAGLPAQRDAGAAIRSWACGWSNRLVSLTRPQGPETLIYQGFLS